MDKSKEAIMILNETYDLEDLNKEEMKKIRGHQVKINKHQGMMSMRSKQINIKLDKVKRLIRIT